MKCEIILIGRTTEKYLGEGIQVYLKRLKHYLPVEMMVLSSSDARLPEKVRAEEEKSILSKFKPRDFIILLDEKGTNLSSPELAARLENWMVQGHTRLLFITGGAFGVSDKIRERANFILSFSKLTFTHQMIRLILVEQLYRAFTILRNESYHH